MPDSITTAPLWTRDYTIMTVGSAVSMIGSAIAGFAMGLLVLDYTGSTFMYAMFMVMYNLPKVVAPTVAGPFLDKFSRRRTIYTLDFISTGIYGIFALLISTGYFNYGYLLVCCVILGTIDSVYQVTFESFYPMLVSKGSYTKAYSILSTLESLSVLVIPVSALLYNLIGIAPLFLMNMVSFFIAAVMETKISRIPEPYTAREQGRFGLGQYRQTFREGREYLKSERGLLAITLYCSFSMFAAGAFSTLVLPYFKLHFAGGEYIYVFTMGWTMVGRVLGGMFHYKIRFPAEKKFRIALAVYLILSVLDGTMLYLPIAVMMVMCFAEGILGVTSYNIRISATQSYVPDGKKGRFNGLFQMASMAGLLLGELLSGVCSEFFPERVVISGFMLLNLLAALIIMGGNREHVEKIYNRHA